MFYVHVNRNTIDSNRKTRRDDPPVCIRDGKHGKPEYGRRIKLPAGSEIVYRSDGALLPCGARLVIECPEKPEIVS
jgi:hypothetical protein